MRGPSFPNEELARRKKCECVAGCATAEEKVVASLPQLQPVPSTFEGCVKAEMWDAWGLTLADRKVGAAVSHQVLHVPGECRLSSDTAKN